MKLKEDARLNIVTDHHLWRSVFVLRKSGHDFNHCYVLLQFLMI